MPNSHSSSLSIATERPSSAYRFCIVVCTRNPASGAFNRCMKGILQLAEQEANCDLVLVDNASEPPLLQRSDLSLPDFARIVHEPQTGLVNARLRGIAACGEADWILFVDDDNVLPPDYIAIAREIIHEHPQLGVFGGSQNPEFEAPPTAAMRPFLPSLAIREIKEASLSYEYNVVSTPYGAGMFVRSDVAQQYSNELTRSPLRRNLGRVDSQLGGCEDTDIAFTACDLGLAYGLFPQLAVLHLIPARRLNMAYLQSLARGAGGSDIRLRAIRFPESIGFARLAYIAAKFILAAISLHDPAAPARRAFRKGQVIELLALLRQPRKPS